MSLKEFYRPDEVMEILDIKKATFYRLVSRIEKPLPAVKTGRKGHLRVNIVKFNLWIKDNEVDPAGIKS